MKSFDMMFGKLQTALVELVDKEITAISLEIAEPKKDPIGLILNFLLFFLGELDLQTLHLRYKHQ